MGIMLIDQKTGRSTLEALAPDGAIKMVKAVVDIDRKVMAVGGDLHVEMQEFLAKHGSSLKNLWGVRILFAETLEGSLEYISQINDRPMDGNSSLRIHDIFLCGTIRRVIEQLVDWKS